MLKVEATQSHGGSLKSIKLGLSPERWLKVRKMHKSKYFPLSVDLVADRTNSNSSNSNSSKYVGELKEKLLVSPGHTLHAGRGNATQPARLIFFPSTIRGSVCVLLADGARGTLDKASVYPRKVIHGHFAV
ncbi:hypothetical protein E2C01_034462 [Portunus trituberculatus]|uniref:Uncharacterized protein n=1 Tax=Portunus trituberculatus TaxID=210409 RepID=A0A5B7F711_PORTR|nr:hypothetical protein [Portunus trituberculatus]